jgi:hypothetical protein
MQTYVNEANFTGLKSNWGKHQSLYELSFSHTTHKKYEREIKIHLQVEVENKNAVLAA